MDHEVIDNWNAAALTASGEMDATESQAFLSKLESLHRLDDPIEPYLHYLSYIKSHSVSQEIVIETLQRCTHDFKDDDIYKDDVRYLKIWLQYIQFSDSPYDIYLYLFKKGIGFRLGILYHNFSDYLEKVGDYQKCYEVYKFGIGQKFLRNIESLKDNFESFKQRLVNYEKLSGVIDRTSQPFLSKVHKRKHSLDSELVQAKKMKSTIDSNLYCSKYQIVRIEGKPDERWRLNLKLIYSETGEEFTPEEIMCQNRGIYDLKYNRTDARPSERAGLRLLDNMSTTTTTTAIPLNDITDKSNNSIPPALPMKPASEDIEVPTSPTMTMFTKEANDEIMSIFNKQIPHSEKEEELETLAHEKKPFQVKVDDHDESNEPQTPPHRSTSVVSGDSNSTRRTNLVPYMTPIPELTENSTKTSDLASSPFIEEPSPISSSVQEIGSVINPLDDKIRSNILQKSIPPLSSYEDYNVYKTDMNKLQVLKKFFSSTSKKAIIGNKNSMVEFDNELYCVVKKLGEGGYATVYLAESSTGGLDAIKIEKPSNPWEFYILKQIENRLPDLKSIITAKGLNLYNDEGFLILEYLKQGTLLDLTNHYKAIGESIDERLTMLIAIELIGTVNALHGAKIIHGDLKPDNCMLNVSDKDDNFLKIIDFGRSIDLSVLPPGVRFQSDWETDDQDCPEMRRNETWVFEVDYFGLANILHTLLFQDTIKIIETRDGYSLKNSIKRYWNDNWGKLFKVLLNSKKNDDTGIVLKEIATNFSKQLDGSQSQLDKLKNELKLT